MLCTFSFLFDNVTMLSIYSSSSSRLNGVLFTCVKCSLKIQKCVVVRRLFICLIGTRFSFHKILYYNASLIVAVPQVTLIWEFGYYPIFLAIRSAPDSFKSCL